MLAFRVHGKVAAKRFCPGGELEAQLLLQQGPGGGKGQEGDPFAAAGAANAGDFCQAGRGNVIYEIPISFLLGGGVQKQAGGDAGAYGGPAAAAIPAEIKSAAGTIK